MIINSDFKDYYDKAASYGIDKTVAWNRRSVKYFHVRRGDGPAEGLNRITDKKITTAADLLGFRHIESHELSDTLLFCGEIWVIVYDTTSDLVRIISEKEAEAVSTRKIKSRKLSWMYGPWGGGYGARHAAADLIHKAYESPVILVAGWRHGSSSITVNPSLRKIGFYQDASMIFSKIHSYLSPKDKETVKVADKYRIAAHGYDKDSFRHEPGGPARKRKKAAG
jgi:hypothetical protein